MSRAAAFLLALAAIPAQARDSTAPAGWSIAAEGSGIPVGQKPADYAVEVDREVTHGGKAVLSIRSVGEKPEAFRSATQFLKADAYRGKRIRLAGSLKSREVDEFSGIWLRVDGPGGVLGFDNMDHRQVKGTTDWARSEVVLDVPEVAARVAFGVLLMGKGQVWADDLSLEVVDPKQVRSTQQNLFSTAFADQFANLDFEATGSSASVPGWEIHAHDSRSYPHRVAEEGAHGGRTFLEARAAGDGVRKSFSAVQNVAATPYLGKRIRIRAYFKTDAVADEAFLMAEVRAKTAWVRRSTRGRGQKGRTDWQAQEIVLDVPLDAEVLGLCAELEGDGTFGVDDASVEVVDPAKVALTPETDRPAASRRRAPRRDRAARARPRPPRAARPWWRRSRWRDPRRPRR